MVEQVVQRGATGQTYRRHTRQVREIMVGLKVRY